METCQICNRELGDVYIDDHHLIPKCKKGKETIKIHKICHNIIHATFTEKELEKYYFTVERIIADEKIQRFIEWVQNKPLDFYVKTKDNTQRKAKRKS